MKTMRRNKLCTSMKSFAVLKPVAVRRAESVNPNRKYVPLKLFSNENSLSDVSEFSSFSEPSVMSSVLGKHSFHIDFGSSETRSLC